MEAVRLRGWWPHKQQGDAGAGAAAAAADEPQEWVLGAHVLWSRPVPYVHDIAGVLVHHVGPATYVVKLGTRTCLELITHPPGAHYTVRDLAYGPHDARAGDAAVGLYAKEEDVCRAQAAIIARDEAAEKLRRAL